MAGGRQPRGRLAEGRTGDTVVEPGGRPARTRHPAVTYKAFWVDAR